MTKSTQEVLMHHSQALREGIESILSDYTDDSVLIGQQGTFRGLAEIRTFFTSLPDALPEGVMEAMTLKHQEIVGEVAYVVWDALPWIPLGTDTLIVKNGKIMFQRSHGLWGSCTRS
jgi:hypothetical protein